MHSTEGLRLKAIWEVKVYDQFGNLKQKEVKENLIVNSGYELLFDALFKEVGRPNVVKYIGIGTSNTAPEVSQTSLGNEVGTRVAGTYVHTFGTKVATISGTFVENNPPTAAGIVEAGLFTESTGGIMLNRVVFNVINKEIADTLTITVSIAFT